MAHEKLYTPKQAARAVLDKVGELLKKSEFVKSEMCKGCGKMMKGETKHDRCVEIHKAEMPWKKPEKDADQHAEGKGPKGEIKPKEEEQAPKDGTREQVDPQHNPKEQAEGNNELAGTTPTQVGEDGKNKPGYDEMKSHLKLAKFIGYMEHKRLSKKAI